MYAPKITMYILQEHMHSKHTEIVPWECGQEGNGE